MSEPNPYRPPDAPIADQDRPRGRPVKGMVYGVLVDIGGSLVAAFVLSVAWAMWLSATGLDSKEIAQEMTEAEATSPISVAGYLVGTACSWAGGYVCARVARETEMRCAAVVATISTLIALLTGTGLSLPLYIVSALITAGAVMLGGWMGAQRNARA